MICKKDLLTQKKKRHAAFAVEIVDIVDQVDIVDLVSKAWDESHAHISTNQKAVAEQGWGPLNYNFLLNLGIQLTSTSNLQTEANNYQPVSSIPPSGINLSQGINGALLVDQVVQYRHHEDARNRINLDKLASQQKETAPRAITSNKRYTASLYVATGRFIIREAM